MKVVFSFIFIIIFSNLSWSQKEEKDSLILQTYLDVYYGVNLNLVNTEFKDMPAFLFNHHRHNEFNLNLGLINLSYNSERIRANLGLMAGTYANQNLANEPGVLKNIYQGNVGVSLIKDQDLWLDVGILEAHTGYESAISKDQNFLTRSILAENSPYFSTGASLNYTTKNEEWYFAGFLLNGWQNIVRPNEVQMPAFGHQVKYSPNQFLTLNSSSYFGRELGINNLKNRIFHNFFTELKKEDYSIILGFDYGMQESESLQTWDEWIGAIFEIRKNFKYNFSVGGRIEYFFDDNNSIIPVGQENLFENYGFTLGIDYNIEDLALLRLEGKYYDGSGDYYRFQDGFTDNLFLISFGISFDLNKKLK